MTTLFLAVLLSASPISPSPTTDAEWRTFAEEAYKRGLDARTDTEQAQAHFAQAARGYQHLWVSGARTSADTRNLAQAYFLAGDIARSIGAYRRGLIELPNDPDLLAGLSAVREQVAYPRTGDLAEAAKPRDPFVTVPSSWFVVGVLGVLYLAGWWYLVRAWFAGGASRWLLGGVLVVGPMAGGIWLYAEQRAAKQHWATPTAVVLVGGTELRTGNSDEYPRRVDGRLPAGVELTIRAERGGWLQVELANGVVGWVPKASVAEFR